MTATRLNDSVLSMIRDAVRSSGSFVPEDNMFHIEEKLTVAECKEVEAFLRWVSDNDKTFGWNIPEVYQEFVESRSA